MIGGFPSKRSGIKGPGQIPVAQGKLLEAVSGMDDEQFRASAATIKVDMYIASKYLKDCL